MAVGHINKIQLKSENLFSRIGEEYLFKLNEMNKADDTEFFVFVQSIFKEFHTN